MTTTTRPSMVFIGKCGFCGTARRGYVGPFQEVEQLCEVCPGHSVVRMLPIKGAASDKPCDARCTSATGRYCNCQCAGRNHGSSHDWRADTA